MPHSMWNPCKHLLRLLRKLLHYCPLYITIQCELEGFLSQSTDVKIMCLQFQDVCRMSQHLSQHDSVGPELRGHTGRDTVQVEDAVNDFADRVNSQVNAMWRRWSNILLTSWTYCRANLTSVDNERQHSNAVHSHWRWAAGGCGMDTQVAAHETLRLVHKQY